jgi:hypothetical protein
VVLEESTCSCFDGRAEYDTDCFGYISTSPEDYQKLKDHYDDVTKRLEICIQSPKRCQ